MAQAGEDGELAGRAIRGDRAAFAGLMDRHYDLIYRVSYRILGSAADAEDVTQDVCLALVGKLAQFRGQSRFTTWLCSIAVNQCRDFLRRRRTSQALVAKYGVLRELEDADRADSDKRSAWLRESLARLDPGLREAAVLVVGEDMSHAEAAAILGCAESTVSWRMHMVKKRLREQMGHADE